MAVQSTASKQHGLTALAALLSLAALHAAPVLAASDHEILCEESHAATLEVAEQELTARPVSHNIDASDITDLASSSSHALSKDHLLKPRVEAAVREVFTEADASSLAEEEPVTEPDEAVIQELGAPPMSDGKIGPLKRQMYRRDI